MKLMSNCSPVGACALELYSVRNVAATNTGRQDALSAGDFVTLGGERRQLPGPLGQVGDPSPHPGGARLIDTRRRGRRQAATSPGGGSPGRFCFGKAGDSRAGPDLVLTIPARQGPAGLLCAAGLGPFGPNTMNGSSSRMADMALSFSGPGPRRAVTPSTCPRRTIARPAGRAGRPR